MRQPEGYDFLQRTNHSRNVISNFQNHKLNNIIYKNLQLNFKRSFTIALVIPLLISTFYIIDFYFLTSEIILDEIIDLPKNKYNNPGYRRPNTDVYKYKTKTKFSFTSNFKYFKKSKIEVTHSPIFKSIKEIKVSGKNQTKTLLSGLNGRFRFLYFISYSSLIFSLIFINLKRKINENVKLNLIGFNLFLFVISLFIILAID